MRPNAVCTTPVQSSKTLLIGSPAQERCWPTTYAHLIGHEIRGTIIQLCRKEPALWQAMSGTIIQLCRKKSLPLGRSPVCDLSTKRWGGRNHFLTTFCPGPEIFHWK